MAEWRERAACGGEDPELFFPIGEGPVAQAQVERAKAVCARCPVVRECLAWAMESGQDAGVWGGRTEQERRQLRRDVSLLAGDDVERCAERSANSAGGR